MAFCLAGLGSCGPALHAAFPLRSESACIEYVHACRVRYKASAPCTYILSCDGLCRVPLSMQLQRRDPRPVCVGSCRPEPRTEQSRVPPPRCRQRGALQKTVDRPQGLTYMGPLAAVVAPTCSLLAQLTRAGRVLPPPPPKLFCERLGEAPLLGSSCYGCTYRVVQGDRRRCGVRLRHGPAKYQVPAVEDSRHSIRTPHPKV